jgi:hypothetical protein
MPAIGLQSTPDKFFASFFLNWCLVFSGESFGIIFCGLFYAIGFSVTATSGNHLNTFLSLFFSFFKCTDCYLLKYFYLHSVQ